MDRFLGLIRERCGLKPKTRLEVSFMNSGVREVVSNVSALTRFLSIALEAAPLPGGSRGPAPQSLGVIEFDEDDCRSPNRSPQLCTFVGTNVSSPTLQLGGSDDETTQGEDSSKQTPAQKARLAAAHFLGKTIDPSDLVPASRRDQLDNSGSFSSVPSLAAAASPKNLGATNLLTRIRGSGVASKLMSSVVAKIKRGSIMPNSNQQQQDGLSTRNLFLHAASITVPTEDEMKSLFSSLAKGGTTIDRQVLVDYLIKKYDDVGDKSKFYRLLGLPVAAVSSHATATQSSTLRNNMFRQGVNLEEFSMLIYRLVRE
jgi:hypothetical protein